MTSFMIFSFILLLLIFIIVLATIFGFVRYLGAKDILSSSCNYENDSAIKILRERYAKGEINKEEFEERKKELMS